MVSVGAIFDVLQPSKAVSGPGFPFTSRWFLSRGLWRDHQYALFCPSSLILVSALDTTTCPFPDHSNFHQLHDWRNQFHPERQPDACSLDPRTWPPSSSPTTLVPALLLTLKSERYLIGGPFVVIRSDPACSQLHSILLACKDFKSPNSTRSDHLRRIYGLVLHAVEEGTERSRSRGR